MNKNDLINRMKFFAISILKLAREFPAGIEFNILKRQLIRCSTSVGANYRAACRAKSLADFIYKLKIVEEELDETAYWIEIIISLEPNLEPRLNRIYIENQELLSIIVATIKTLRKKNPKS